MQNQQVFQAVVDAAPRARQYFADQNPIYPALVYYPGKFAVSEGKADTFTVEGSNADLRHYLARLARRSRCFSRCPHALQCALQLFVFCYNQRQLYKQTYPRYPSHLIDFVTPLN